MWSERLVRGAPRRFVVLLLVVVLIAGAGIVHPAAVAAFPAPANQTTPVAANQAPPAAPHADIQSAPLLLLPPPPSSSHSPVVVNTTTSRHGPVVAAHADAAADISDAALVRQYDSTLLSVERLPSLKDCDARLKPICDTHFQAVRQYRSAHGATKPDMDVIDMLQKANELGLPRLDDFCAALNAQVADERHACRLVCRQPGEFGGLTVHPICRRTLVVHAATVANFSISEVRKTLARAKLVAFKRVTGLLTTPLPPATSAPKADNTSAAALIEAYNNTLLSVDLWQPLANCTPAGQLRLCHAHEEAVRAYHAHRPTGPPPNMEIIQLLHEAAASTCPTVRPFCAALPADVPLRTDCAVVCADGETTHRMCHRIWAIYELAADTAMDSMAEALVIVMQRISRQLPRAEQPPIGQLAPAAAAVAITPLANGPAAETVPAERPSDVRAAANLPAVAKITDTPNANAELVADIAATGNGAEAPVDGDRPDDAKLEDPGELAGAGLDGLDDREEDDDDDIDMAGDLNGASAGAAAGSDADTKLVETAAGNGGREPSIVQRDPFVDDEESSFFSYFMFALLVCVAVYVLYQNRRLLLALMLEGRRRNGTSAGGRRKHTAAYRKLDANLEEAISSSSSSNAAHGGSTLASDGGRPSQPIIY